MKKKLIIVFLLLIFPLTIIAYTTHLIPGGETIGITINSKGLVVVGFYKVNGDFIGKKYLKIGDTILNINGIEVNSVDDLTNVIDENTLNEINVKVKRNNKIIDTKMSIELENNVYKTGLYIKDNIVGIGTLTYVDPESGDYGGLGHEISFNQTNTRIEVKDGNILESKITSIDRSYDGHVGSKNAKINYNNIIGNIKKNTEFGIFGKLKEKPKKNLIEIGEFKDIHKGKATIYTVTKDNIVKEYEINIINKYNDKKDTTKAFSFEITDKELLNETGGIVQGMSGSPIIQDNKIIGGVTHVLVDNVVLGYGIYIKTMLEEGNQ